MVTIDKNKKINNLEYEMIMKEGHMLAEISNFYEHGNCKDAYVTITETFP